MKYSCRLAIAALVGFGFGVPAQAATIGLTCDGVAQIVVAATMTEAGTCVAKSFGTCAVGFRVSGGYYAVAASEDGLAQGAAGGFRTSESARSRAISTCESAGAGACAVTASALDDGTAMLNCE